MLSISQSVKLWVCSIGHVVGFCYRSVSLSSCGSNIGHVVDFCCRSVSLSNCGSVASIRLWVCAAGQSVGLAVVPCPAMCLYFIPSETPEAPRWSQEVPWSVNKK